MAKHKRRNRPSVIDVDRALDVAQAAGVVRPRVGIPDAAFGPAVTPEDPTHANGLDETPATPAIDLPSPSTAPVDANPLVLTAKPVTPPTLRLARMAWDKFTAEMAEIAAECAAAEGIDQSCYRLGLLSFPPTTPGSVAWVPR